jgi:hypothetical protein
MRLRPWGVILAVPDGRRGVDFTQTEFPIRTYATEERAQAAAKRLTTDDGDGSFVAARVSSPVDADWPIGEVVEYRDGEPRRFNICRGECWETS